MSGSSVLNPQALLDWLVSNRPEEELVFSHGDYCLPNVFLQDGSGAGGGPWRIELLFDTRKKYGCHREG